MGGMISATDLVVFFVLVFFVFVMKLYGRRKTVWTAGRLPRVPFRWRRSEGASTRGCV
jgi:hypothetical protein